MTNITIHINGKEIAAQISDEAAAELLQEKRTGYERVARGEKYFREGCDSGIDEGPEENSAFDDEIYEVADYYSDKTISDNNARADKLMRQLRQWQALNDAPVDWSCVKQKWQIQYNYIQKIFFVEKYYHIRTIANIYFSSHKKAQEAIDVFRDELTWYFTEYRSRLDELDEARTGT